MDDFADELRLINDLYQAALDPASFESLLNEWDRALLTSTDDQPPQLDLSVIDQHAERATEILSKLDLIAPSTPVVSMSERIEQDRNPALLLNADGDVISRNLWSEAFFEPKMKMSLTDLFISAEISEEKGRELLKQLKNADGHGEVIGFFHIHSCDEENRVFMVLLTTRCPVDHRVRALLRTLSGPASAKTLDAVQKQFELTDAETSVIGNLVNGDTLKQISENRGTSIHTVRTQLKFILGKTGFTSQTDLVRHMCFLHNFQSPNAISAVGSAASARGSERAWHTLRLHNGQTLDYLMLGPPGGRPVLYLHGMIDALDFPAEFQHLLAEQNILLIAPIRPHYGFSKLKPGEEDFCAFFAECTAELLDHLSIRRIVLCGHMAGTVYGFEFAKRYPDRVIGLVSVAGAVPMIEHWQFSGMSKGHRIAGLTARHSPKLLSMLTRGAIRLLQTGREKFMLNLFLHDSPKDRALAERSELRNILFKRFHFITGQGETAFVHDIKLVSGDWSKRVGDFKMPVSFVHGTEDHVVLIKGVERFASCFENTKFIAAKSAGQLLLFSHFPDVLREMSNLHASNHVG
ncbi:MAG: alpha/beta fold hydrolase [Hyphomicrobiales bacterium]